MSNAERWHEFIGNGTTWSVARCASSRSERTGLCFRHGDETRFLVFTRGAMPSDRELESMGEEVLGVLLQRAVPQ